MGDMVHIDRETFRRPDGFLGITHKQAELLGIDWPLTKGWTDKLERTIDRDIFDQILAEAKPGSPISSIKPEGERFAKGEIKAKKEVILGQSTLL